ncbi:UvrD-helicase domain-containing protein [Rhodococcus sp. F64268]|uniref:3'-5' exonuclease n=1 Tax=Rhodococcus sp. F64268 TaxID=2926402 RepID=UPI001FF13973|nr:3'-5' exonuclease [Rhodococcus sp. F64268]MCK0093740.1 UvrD-helicase domain-containing protein [Rhodococcus sp. F64268]
MANLVIASNTKAMKKLEKSTNDKVWAFIEKLSADHTAPGLHIEPIQGAIDPRVRTGRVDLNFRAILFKVDSKLGDDPTFIYMGTWKHDVANKLAERSKLRVNPINGVLEGIIGELDGEEDRKKRTVVPDPRGELNRAVKEQPKSYLGATFSLSDLTDRLGLELDLAERALAAPDEDTVLDIAANAVGWQGSALLDLATGLHIDTIREKHGFTDTPVDDTLDEDEQILKALEQPASKMQFTFAEDNEELRRVIEGGDFAAWRTFLHPEQRKYVEQNFNGAFRLSGGAGTGKTVVAIHRARRMAKEDPTARIVLTTYNKTLAADLKAALKTLDPEIPIADRPGEPGIYVDGIDALGYAVLNQTGDIGDAAEAVLGYHTELTHQRTSTDKLWREVAQSVNSGLDPKLATPGFLENEYVAVILANKVTTLEQYAKVARPGRGVRLTRPQRIAVWKLVEAFRRQSRIDGSLSFPEILALAAEQLRLRAEAGNGFIADRVLIDEAQDLHATHWALLRSLVAEGPNDLFIAEDSHQRIYGQPVVLKRLGIKIVGRARRLTLNYRTTAQNLHFAVSVLAGAEYKDLEQGEESTTEYRSARLGPDPRLVECKDPADELDQVAALIRSWIEPHDEGNKVDPSTIAVLTRGQNDRSQFVRALGERGIEARALDNSPATSGHVQVLTMHRAKGMEFSRVILAGVDNAHVPSAVTLRSIPEEEQAEALLRERSLLYVAASRARDALVVTWSGKRSELLG